MERSQKKSGSADATETQDAVGGGGLHDRARLLRAAKRRKDRKNSEEPKKNAAVAEKGALAPPENIFAADGADEEGERGENTAFEDNAVLGGAHRMEHAKSEEAGVEDVGETAELASKGADAIGVGGASERVLRAFKMPNIIEKLQKGDFSGAFTELVKLADPIEVAEAAEHIAPSLGFPRLGRVFKFFAEHGTELNALMAMVEWTKKGFREIREAHERGDQENRIDLYADAYAHAFLLGDPGQAALRAATDEEREAVKSGSEDGAAAAGATGELAPVIAQELLKRYGSPEGAARHIKSELLKRAGLESQAKARTGA